MAFNEFHVHNGRIDILSNNIPTPSYTMTEQSNSDNNPTSYDDALTGTYTNSVLSRAFFSKENIQIIHNGIRAGVYNKSNGRYVIGTQSIDNIKIIMRSTYLEYARHKQNITEEIKELNSIVLDYCIHNAYNEATSYLQYKKDVSTMAVPLNKPESTYVKGSKQLQTNPWI